MFKERLPSITMTLLTSASPVTLLGGGECTKQDLSDALKIAPVLVAADGGADHALRWGRMPEAVIGDLDSLSQAARESTPKDRVHRIGEQDSTDFDKTLRSVEAPLFLGVGFTGRRIDHELAVLSTLVRRPDKPCLLLGAQDVVMAAPRQLNIRLPIGTRLSLFPLAPVEGRSSGLRWPIDGLSFAPNGQIGTSNEVTGPVSLEFSGPGMLLILPRAALGSLLSALLPAAPAK